MTDLAPLASGIAVERIAGLERAMEQMDALIAKCLRRAIRAGTRGLGEVVTAAGEKSLSSVSLDDLAAIDTAWRQALAAEILPALGRSFDDGVAWTIGELAALGAQAGATVGLSSPAAVAYLAGAEADLRVVGTATWGKVRLSLADGLKAGESIDELAARIRAEVAVSEVQARRLARTNVIGATNAGSLAQVSTMPAEEQPRKVWLATNDARTRLTHRAASGQQRALNEPFTVGGAHLQFPADPLGPDAEIQNCRCTLTWDFGPPPVAEEDVLG